MVRVQHSRLGHDTTTPHGNVVSEEFEGAESLDPKVNSPDTLEIRWLSGN